MLERGVGVFFRDRFLDRGSARTIHVLVARDPIDRARALFGVSDFSGDRGMVLDLERPTRVAITTAGMRVPIDVVFVDEAGSILGVVDDAPPDSGVYRSPGLARYVVELPAGAARAIGLTGRSSFEFVRAKRL
jgi:hypothetical protein